MQLLYGHDSEIAEIVSKRFGGINLQPCSAIGLLKDNLIVGAVVYNNFHKNNVNIPISIEATVILVDSQELSRYIVSALFSYPFAVLKVGRLQVTVARKHKRVRKLVERLGFKFEGIARQGYILGGDAAVYSMLPDECRWIRNAVSPIQSRSSTDSRRTDRI